MSRAWSRRVDCFEPDGDLGGDGGDVGVRIEIGGYGESCNDGGLACVPDGGRDCGTQSMQSNPSDPKAILIFPVESYREAPS